MPIVRLSSMVLLLVLGSGPTNRAAAQAPGHLTALTMAKLRELLTTSPLLEPTMGVAEQAQYVADAREALQGVPGAFAVEIESATDAAATVERILAGSSVRAEILSDPPGKVVSYRRLIDPAAALTQATTNDTISVAPALYLFIARDAHSGRTDSLKVACAAGCRARFVFPR